MTDPPSFPDLVDARWPGDTALLLEEPGRRRLTYGEASRASARYANALLAAGARRGDRVAVQVEKSPDALLVKLACLRAGLVLLPVNPSATPAEVAHLLADAEVAVAVTDPARVPDGARCLTLDADGAGTLADAAAGQPDGLDVAPVAPGDVATLLYTSGTTGKPKGAPLTHANVTANLLALQEAWGYGPTDRLLHALPIHHTHGLLVAAGLALVTGSSMTWLPRFDLDAVLDALPSCTVLMGVPTFYTRLLADPRLDRDRCATVRLFVSGSAPLPATVHEAFEARTGHRVLERYGMTETMMLTSNPLHGERRPGSVGLPLPGVEVRVTVDPGVDPGVGAGSDGAGGERERDAADGVGGVEVRGPNVFAGYWGRTDRSADFTDDGWFRTGDLGAFDADGYLRLVGRSKDLVISGGLNVYPAEVEDVLDRVDGVAESAVIGVPHDDLGEAVVAVVVPRPGASLDPAAVRAAARERLAGYKVPKVLHVVDELPRNHMGKIEKAVLRRRFG